MAVLAAFVCVQRAQTNVMLPSVLPPQTNVMLPSVLPPTQTYHALPSLHPCLIPSALVFPLVRAVQRFLKPDTGVSIPQACTSFAAPIMSPKLWNEVKAYKEPKWFETA